jgi:phosphatidate cytidylyltransferase
MIEMEGRLTLVICALFVSGAVLMALSHKLRKTGLSQVRADWMKYGVYLVLVISLLLSAYWSRWLTAVVFGIIVFGGSVELYRNLPKGGIVSSGASLVFFVTASMCLGHLLLGDVRTWFPAFAFVFLLVATTDSLSQLWGKLLGSHKLCPRLSPGKTQEGLLGGFVSAAVVSIILGFLLPGATVLQLTSLAVIIAASATGGDLTFSYVKRKIGIKDFSGILPGHGGILDRFDSLMVAAPVYYWTKALILN